MRTYTRQERLQRRRNIQRGGAALMGMLGLCLALPGYLGALIGRLP